MPRFPLGAFAAGLAGGLATGQTFAMREKAEKRAEAAEKRAAEDHTLTKQIKELGLGRMKREEPLHEKEVQVKGAKLDYDLAEQTFMKSMQDFEQGTRKLLSQGQRAGAQAGLERQPDEIALAREQLNANIANVVQQQTANVWGVLKSGNDKLALDMFNKSKLLMPGQTATGFKIEDVDIPGPDGKSAGKAPVLTIALEGGKTKQIPVASLEGLQQRYGAQYKTVGKDLVRIGSDGKATVLHSSDEYVVVPEGGSMASRRSGTPAAGGVNPGGGGRAPGSDRTTARVDARVQKAKGIVDRYFGISEFTGLDAKNQPKYSKIVALAGEKVRAGTAPEAAAKAAIDEVNAAEAARAPGAGGAAGYSGPAPWRR